MTTHTQTTHLYEMTRDTCTGSPATLQSRTVAPPAPSSCVAEVSGSRRELFGGAWRHMSNAPDR